MNIGTGALPINEVFETLQGEATYTGQPAVFVRLQGCPIACGFCDTKHTWALRPEDEVSASVMLAKVDAAQTYALLTPEDLLAMLGGFRARHIVLTGGEPCLFDIVRLTTVLIEAGYAVQVETSGTHEIRVHENTWVTVSPKIGMPGGYEVRQDAVARADEIKMPVGAPRDVEKLRDFLAEYSPRGSVWVQPLSRSSKATALCIQAATDHGWRVSIQTHAFIGVR